MKIICKLSTYFRTMLGDFLMCFAFEVSIVILRSYCLGSYVLQPFESPTVPPILSCYGQCSLTMVDPKANCKEWTKLYRRNVRLPK